MKKVTIIKIISIVAISAFTLAGLSGCCDSHNNPTDPGSQNTDDYSQWDYCPPGANDGGEGACSWHSCVDCSAGPDGDWSCLCHDGWRDSSVDYFKVCCPPD